MSERETIVVVTRKTALEELVLRLNSRAQARFYLEQNGVSFDEYERADTQYHRAVEALVAQLPRGVKQVRLDRELLPTYQFGARDLVVTIGPDGLVINVAKYLDGQPIFAVNPDPGRIDGVLLPFTVADTGAWISRALRGHVAFTQVSMARAELNDGQMLDAVNDLFIGARTHVSARYQIALGERSERQSSSGIVVSTGAGCTGWLSAIVGGACRIAQQFGADHAAPSGSALALGWGSERLWYAVREPFVSRTSQATLVFGQLEDGQELVLTSEMPENGAIFSDGIEADYLAFNAGSIARIGLSARKAHLLVRGK
ncbi:MAG TPA: hypothetical protein VFX76_22970 [Roseiflexaceae bacterium]|nr:hypothetical protein [Roseiflexaceae bacterium]